ncbi:uncharacterized protein LOC125778901 [Bactrocera dorsalis]|uniref:Uncharacterized protein LOC125778901 n=1 Tax=Bactrocera dorsalis TaxID=27457 RepID=A0ABM3JZ24_BACDO|nr:uncharacterized protein LOC125778901 [Bactrocera dorsalis]
MLGISYRNDRTLGVSFSPVSGLIVGIVTIYESINNGVEIGIGICTGKGISIGNDTGIGIGTDIGIGICTGAGISIGNGTGIGIGADLVLEKINNDTGIGTDIGFGIGNGNGIGIGTDIGIGKD